MIECIAEPEYELIRELVYRHSRIALGANKKELVSGRISKRLRHLGLPSFEAYCEYLRSVEGQEELAGLIDVISTNHTRFFRDPDHFEFVMREILPRVCLGGRGGGRGRFRVWSAACSSGEEPYSLALCLADFFGRMTGWTWEVEATDISGRMIERGSRGIYDANQVVLPRGEWLQRYFQRGVNEFEGCYRVKEDVRDRVRFTQLNLFQAAFPFRAGFDVIFCRNVMIYFDRPSQEQLVRLLGSHLAPGGYLFVGPSESLIRVAHGLRYVQPSIYRKE